MSAPFELVFGTKNAGKLRELQHLVGERIRVLSLDAFGDIADVDEDQDTFEGNAQKKALAYARSTQRWALADDSGLCVDALNGAPGVYSARYGPGSDADRAQKLLQALTAVPKDHRGAQFRCVLCLASPEGKVTLEAGECRGEIALAASGTGGFGYDPVFLYPPQQKTLAELTLEEKAAISHRGLAFRRMLPHLIALSP